METITLLFERLRPKKKSPNQETQTESSETSLDDFDLSLKANPDTYNDREKESETIFKRILSNSSSVIGIGGVRGAGKSSLALKVLGYCKKEDFFTILIPSPTAYDSKEFLLTVYQSICEDVKLQLEKRLNLNTTLKRQSRRELLLTLFTVFLY